MWSRSLTQQAIRWLQSSGSPSLSCSFSNNHLWALLHLRVNLMGEGRFKIFFGLCIYVLLNLKIKIKINTSFLRLWNVEGDNQKLIVLFMCSERNFGYILLLHSYLMIPWPLVQFGKQSSPKQFIKDFIHYRDGRFILVSMLGPLW